MKALSKLTNTYHPYIASAMTVIATLVWIKLYLNIHMELDLAWLLHCLDRFMEGGSYTKDFYETNPPLSFLIHFPAYLIYTNTATDEHTAVTITFLCYMAISNIVVFKMHSDKNITIILSLILAQTWGMGLLFASKDHLIFIFLAPLCLWQYCITQQQRQPMAINILCIIMGGIAISLKPHYGVITAGFFAHRLYKTQSLLACLKSVDFIGLLLFGLSYIALTIMFVPSFWEILPHITSLYVYNDQPFSLSNGLPVFALTILAFLTSLMIKDQNTQRTIQGLLTISVLCLIPYILQFKGYIYHLAPMLGFTIAALFICIQTILEHRIRNKTFNFSIALAAIVALTFSFTSGGPKPHLTKTEFLELPLIKSVQASAWNKTYANYNLRATFALLPYTTDLKNGSRFGQLWNINGLQYKLSQATNQKERKAIHQQMRSEVSLIAEDMRRFKPSVIFIPQYQNSETGKPERFYLDFLRENEHFQKALNNYEYKESLSMSLELRSKNADKFVLYDIYVLRKDHDL